MGYVKNIDPADYFDDEWDDYEDDIDLGYKKNTGFFSILSFVISGCLAGALTTVCFFAYKDELVNSLISRQISSRQAYEDKIIDLRSEIDIVTSKQLLDQAAFDARIDQLLDRQRQIEAETSLINMIVERTNLRQLANIDETTLEGYKKRAMSFATASVNDLDAERHNAESILTSLNKSVDRLGDNRQTILASVESSLTAKQEVFSEAVRSIGINPDTVSSSSESGTGGPFIPVKGVMIDDDFQDKVARLGELYESETALKKVLRRAPIHAPLPNKGRLTSNFGKRKDPINGKWAYHNGVDYRGKTGDPIRAAGAGKVVRAGRSGSYGLMVEIKHDYGMRTRYAHLSKVLVKRGDVISAGTLIGKLGSTGRSTGPHLHYELHKKSKPIDPTGYLKVGDQLKGKIN